MIICGIIIIVIWILNLKNTLKSTDGKSILTTQDSSKVASAETDLDLLGVESVQRSGSQVKIYFNINNQTDDILNVPSLDNITFRDNNNSAHPQQLTDRQGSAFVKKVLTHTQNFGILTFTTINDEKGTLTFDQMFFEKNPEQIFKQILDLEFDKLKNNAQPRT